MSWAAYVVHQKGLGKDPLIKHQNHGNLFDHGLTSAGRTGFQTTNFGYCIIPVKFDPVLKALNHSCPN
jgi:hypothetical protein